jgi:hypothetical protein
MHEKMFNVFSHQENANQNYPEIPTHPTQKSIAKKSKNNKFCEDAGTWGRNPSTLLVGMEIIPVTMETTLKVPQNKTKQNY